MLATTVFGRISPKSKRIINAIVDTLLIWFLYGIFLIVFSGVLSPLIQNIAIFVIAILYYILFEGIFDQTVGKWLTNSKVVYAKTNHRWLWVIVRTLLRFNPFDLISYGMGTGIGIHDRLSFSRVVDK